MEAFSILVEKAVSKGFLFGYEIGNRYGDEMKITHLLLADDTLVFYKDLKDQMANLRWILSWFEAISDMNINLEKSSIMAVGCVEDLESLALELGCNTWTLLTTYLGLPFWVCAAT